MLVATSLAVGALVSAQAASASPAGDALFAALGAAGIPISSREDAVAAGELACDSATSGVARDVIAQKVSDKTGLDIGQADTFVGIAQAVYCPFQPQLAG